MSSYSIKYWSCGCKAGKCKAGKPKVVKPKSEGDVVWFATPEYLVRMMRSLGFDSRDKFDGVERDCGVCGAPRVSLSVDGHCIKCVCDELARFLECDAGGGVSPSDRRAARMYRALSSFFVLRHKEGRN